MTLLARPPRLLDEENRVSVLSMGRGEAAEPQPGGGWISGACTHAPRPSASLPRFNPSAVVLAVQRILGEQGITAIVDFGNADVAVNAAADLLRALGVAPGVPAR